MSLDNIQLNTRVVADLYRNDLISLENNQPEANQVIAENVAYLGKNANHILILIKEPGHKYLAEEDLNFLSKILAAVQLTLADVAIVNCYENPAANYENLIEHLKPSKIIFFEVKAHELGFPLQFAAYKPQKYNGQTYLAAASLQFLQDNFEEKKQFWEALKQLFSN